jgi:filamentous hemagglutinin family protein
MKAWSARRRQVLAAAVIALVEARGERRAAAMPGGGQVVAGSAGISSSGNAMVVRQTTNRAIINWNQFSIGTGESVTFDLPSKLSAVLNRVTTLTPSEIDGTLSSNGSVYLVNPSGIIIGPHGEIDTQSFVASSLDVNDTVFMGGGNLAFAGSSSAAVVNEGTINAMGGSVVLMAQTVQNSGQISARGGSVNLAAGSEVLLQQSSTPGFTVRVVGSGSVSNSGLVQATMAQLAANGGNAMALAINNTGIVRATRVKNVGGHIYLSAGGGEASNNGTLDASSSAGAGGEIVMTGKDVMVGSGSQLLATGTTGGGEILVGGSWENEDSSVPESVGAVVEKGAVLDASATQSGAGGTIVVRSDVENADSVTRAYGTFLAQGAGDGIGGRVETSGHWLDAGGATVSAAGPGGAGKWLLDPYNLVINSSTTNGINETSSPWVPTFSGANVDAADIDTALNGNNSVTIYTGGNSGGGDSGNITVNAPINKATGSGNVTLTLRADNNIIINDPITATSGELNIVLDSHYSTGGTTAGLIILDSNLSTNGGNVSFGTDRTYNGALIGGDVYLNASSAQIISTAPSGAGTGGSVTVWGQVLIANPNGLAIDTAGGAVNFESTVDSGDTYSLGADGSVTWTQAVTDAQSGTAAGTSVGDTYLATITTSLQNQIAANAAGYQPAWLGGHRPIVGGTTSQIWYWVTGPLGQANGGLGTAFFTEYYTDQVFNAPDGTPINGAFTNWNNGEPNNDGGVNTTQAAETSLQFTGTNALWNDISANDNYPYVVQKNLAPSAMTINAGAGRVTFAGLVGSNKPLASLTITGPVTVSGGGITTTGAQTYNNPITLASSSTYFAATASDLTIGSNISYTLGTPGTVTLKSSGSVILSANTVISGAGSGGLGVTLDAAAYGGTSGAIVLDAGSGIDSYGGNVVMGGGSTPGSLPAYGTATYLDGVALEEATISTETGSLTIDGQGYSGGGGENAGVLISRSGGSGVGSSITSGGGAILIEGTGGSSSAGSPGVVINFGSAVTATGGANLTITGVGGSGSGTGNSGVVVDGSNEQVDSGTLTIDGTAGGGTAGMGVSGLSGAQIESTDGGPIFITGVENSGGTGLVLGGGAIVGGASAGNVTIEANTWNVASDTQIQGTGALTIFPASAGTSIGLGDGANGTLDLDSTTLGTIQSGFSGITFGDSAHTSGIQVGTTNLGGNVKLIAGTGGIAVDGNLFVFDELSLSSSGPVTQSAPISAQSLLLSGSGSVTLSDSNNSVETVAGNVSGPGVEFVDFSSLTVGSVSGTNGLSDSAGAVTLVSGSDIVLSQGVSGTGSGTTVVLAAGGNFVNSVGSGAIGTGSGRFLVYSTNPADDTDGGLSAGHLYDETYTGNPPGSIAAGGNLFLFSYSPVLTFTADGKSKVYGQANPALTYQVAGLVNGDTLGAAISGTPAVSTNATVDSGVGNYAITPGAGTLDSLMGYSFDFVAGNLSVTQAPLTITANDASKVYGAALPTFSAGFSGLLNGDSSSVVSGLQFSSSGSAGSGVGEYSITPGGASAANYSISYVGGTLTVTPAPLTIAAVNQARVLNVPNSALSVDFIGLVNADVPGDVPGVTLSTTAQTSSPAGNYPIIVSGGVNGNYDITRVDGTLTVAPLPTEAIQGEWETVQQSAPNFGVVQTSILPTAQTGEQSPAMGLPGNLALQANIPGRVRGRGNIALSREQMMRNAIAHVSSFDVGGAR